VKLALRVFVDFVKEEIQEVESNDLDKSMQYEPLLTHLLSKREYLM
jgi:hypothetical protein